MTDLAVRGRRAAVGFVLATLAMDAVGIGIVIPIIPELVRQMSGLTRSGASAWVGGLLATYSLAQVAAAPILGALSDRFGRRPVILLSVAGIASNYVLLALAPSLPWLFLGRLMAGATGANVSAANAYIADVTPPADRARRFGLVGAVFGAAFVIGPAIGGFLGGIDLRLPFVASAALAGLNFVYGLLVLPESLPPDRRRAFDWRRANPVGSLRALTATRSGKRLAIAWSCIWFAGGTLQTTFVLYTGYRLGWGPVENGTALATVGFFQVLMQGVLVRSVIRVLGERRTALTGFCLSMAAFATLAFADRSWMIYASVVLQACGTMANPATRGLLSVATPADRQGELQGGLSSIEGLTAILSPLVSASLFGFFAAASAPLPIPGAAFLLSVLVFCAAFLSVLGVTEAKKVLPEFVLPQEVG